MAGCGVGGPHPVRNTKKRIWERIKKGIFVYKV
jgi:hypothetical protein